MKNSNPHVLPSYTVSFPSFTDEKKNLFYKKNQQTLNYLLNNTQCALHIQVHIYILFILALTAQDRDKAKHPVHLKI